MSALADCIAGGGVAVIPTDTVYGLCCDAENADAVRRLYELKGRPPDKPAAIMFAGLRGALEALPEIAPRTRALLESILPGPVTVLLENPRRRFPLAGGDALGVRVPALALDLGRAVLQSSANLAGGADPRALQEVPTAIRAGADLELDGGELPGVASTVLDLRDFELTGRAAVLRQGAFRLR
ncbi:MAG: L-threonylcarbamoyladenylate synthase [Solirubrobacteraceae bacterium]